MTHYGWMSDFPTRHGALSLISLLGTSPVLLIHNSPFSFIIFIFVLLSCFQWFAFKNGWHYLETDREATRWSESQREPQQVKGSKVTFQQLYLLYKHFSITRFVSSVHILTCSRRSSFTTAFSFSNYGTPVLSASHRPSHANCTTGRKLGTEVGVNSYLVALIATESVSIALSWLLLPPEVGVNRHSPFLMNFLYKLSLGVLLNLCKHLLI